MFSLIYIYVKSFFVKKLEKLTHIENPNKVVSERIEKSTLQPLGIWRTNRLLRQHFSKKTKTTYFLAYFADC